MQKPRTLLIFDLDNCLLDTPKIAAALLPTFKLLRAQSPAMLRCNEAKAIHILGNNPPGKIVKIFGLEGEEATRFRHDYAYMPVPPETALYDDVWGILEILQAAGIDMILVTKGEEPFQEGKFRVTGIGPFFKKTHIVGHDTATYPDKLTAFTDIIAREQCDPTSVVVIGDNGRDELEAGLRLNCRTVQTLRPGVERFDAAHHHITTLHDLLPILGL